MKNKKYHADNEEDIEERRREKELQREIELKDLRFVLDSPQGRRVMQRLIGNPFQCSMTGNSNTFFNEGLRAMSTKLARELKKANPQVAAQILLEAL